MGGDAGGRVSGLDVYICCTGCYCDGTFGFVLEFGFSDVFME